MSRKPKVDNAVSGISRRRLLVAGGGFLAAACASDRPAATADRGGELRSVLRGRVLLPGDDGFDRARTPWNLTVDQSVRAVAEIADADDAATLVRYARDAGLAVAAQPNGHGASTALDGTILVRTDRLDEVRVDPDRRSARVGAGVSWEPVQQAASAHGLTGVAGSSMRVSVVGYLLGGGLSWFSRRYGWACDSVTAFEAVTADGRAVRVTADSDRDLFWAMRGGGGDYALVTAVEFALYPAPALYGGRMTWPVEYAPRVMSAFREVTATAPEELTTWWNLFQLPGKPATVGIDAVHLGDENEGQSLLSAFDRVDGRTTDTRRVLTVAELGSVTAEPTNPSAPRQYATLLTELDDSTVEKLLAKPIDPLVNVEIRHLGGALARPTDTAAGPVADNWFLALRGSQTSPQTGAAIQARIREYLDQLGESLGSRTPFTFLTPGQSAANAFPADTSNRLRDIKRSHDPTGVLRSNFPVLT